jgi:hypothetical protein
LHSPLGLLHGGNGSTGRTINQVFIWFIVLGSSEGHACRKWWSSVTDQPEGLGAPFRTVTKPPVRPENQPVEECIVQATQVSSDASL